MEKIKFRGFIGVRLSKNELKRVKNVVNHGVFAYKEGNNCIIAGKKYENISNFVRAAVIKSLNEEEKSLKIKKGRPNKYKNPKIRDGGIKW